MATVIARRWGWRIGALLVALGLGVALAFGTYAISLQPGAAIVKAVFEAGPLVTPPSDFDTITAAVAPPSRVELEVPDAPDAFLDIYEPPAGNGDAPMVLWVHGGGFISTSSTAVADYATLLAAQGFVVASLDYSIAPGAEHPVPVRQAAAALAYFRAHATSLGGNPDLLTIGGDSAGAQIASETAAVVTKPALADADGVSVGLPPAALRGVVLFCGLYDMTTVGNSGFPGLRTYLWAYTGERDWLAYADIDAMSTTTQATSAYPPTFVSVGDIDPFAGQAHELAQALDAAGVPVTTLFWDGTGARLSHEYQFDFALPQAQTAFDQTVTFLKSVSTP